MIFRCTFITATILLALSGSARAAQEYLNYSPGSNPFALTPGSGPNSLATGGITARSAADRAADVLNVKDLAVKCDGSTDDTAAINAAVATALAKGASTLLFPVGTCKVSGPTVVSSGTVNFVGAGRGATTISTSSATADVFDFTGTTFDSSVRGMRITSTATTPTAGYGVYTANGVGNIRLSDLRIEKVYNGFGTVNSPVTGVQSLDHVDFANIVNDVAYVNGTSQFFADHVSSYMSGGSCIHIQSAGGYYLQTVTCGGSASALLVNPPTGSSVFDGLVSDFEADTSTGAGLSFDSTAGGKVWGARLTNVRSGYGLGAGFAFNGANTSNITLTNFSSERNAHEGIFIANLQESQIADGQVLGNSTAVAGYYGVNLAGGTGLKLSGLRVTPAYPGQSNSNSAYGIVVQSSFTGVATISGNDVRGHSSNGLVNSSTSTGLRIIDNAGYNPVGPSYPSLGTSPWTYTAKASPELEILSGGTCTNISVAGTTIAYSGSLVTLLLAPGQSMTGTCSVNPNFTSLAQ